MDVDAYKSTDGGHLFNKVKVPHGDNHGLWIDPQNTQRMIASNDGGVTVTLDGGKNWTPSGQPADRAVLPRDHRQPRRRTTSTARSRTTGRWRSPAAATTARSAAATGTTWAAARRAISRPTRGTRTSFTRPTTRALITRYDQHTGQVKAITEQPELSRCAWRGESGAPLPVDRAGHDFAA